MNREKVIAILREEQKTLKVMAEIHVNTQRKKQLEDRVQAYEFVINEIEGNQPKVKVNEFLDSNKNWCISVSVNGELIGNENIEFISKRTAQEVPVQEQPITLEILNNELNINLSQKQYEEISILDICTSKYTAHEILKLLKILLVI